MLNPELLLVELNGYEGRNLWEDVVLPCEVYDERLTKILTSDDTMDFVARFGGETCLYVEDGISWELTKFDISPVYYWDDEKVGDISVQGFDVDAFEKELDHNAPGLFVRKANGVSPGANDNEFVRAFQEQIDRVWHDALETA